MQAKRIGAEVYILAQDGKLISSTNEDTVASGCMPEGIAAALAEHPGENGTLRIGESTYDVAFAKGDSTPWTTVLLAPTKSLTSATSELYLQTILVLAVCGGVFALLILYFYWRFMIPMTQLEEAMRNADAGDLHSDAKPQGPEEVSRMMTTYNSMLDSIPKADVGEVDKRLVSLQAGDELDIIYGTTAQLKVFYDAGVLSPLDEYAAAASYDAPAVFGGSIPYYDDGRMYGLPAFNDVWCTFVNTKVFENAGVEVPSAEGWTWEKYVETAKKLTDVNNEIYGSLMLDYDCYNYMYALQKGAEHYKADGSSNYDDPLFAESVKFFYGLGNEEKIQPDITTYKAGVYPWNAFHSTGKADANGKYDKAQFGMFVCGGWAASMLPNTEKYPRDWKCAILPFPYPEGEQPSCAAGRSDDPQRHHDHAPVHHLQAAAHPEHHVGADFARCCGRLLCVSAAAGLRSGPRCSERSCPH